MVTVGVLLPGCPGGIAPLRGAVNVRTAELPDVRPAVTLTVACPDPFVVRLVAESDIALELLVETAITLPARPLVPSVTVTVNVLDCEGRKSVSTAILLSGPATLMLAMPGPLLTPTVPFFPSLVAVMVARPADDPPVRIPAASTDTLPDALLENVIIRPVSTLFAMSRSTTVRCIVSPGTMKLLGLVTVTVFTGTFTVIADVPTTFAPFTPAPFARASIVAVPAALPVTSPV
jgi:hypothetical protein